MSKKFYLHVFNNNSESLTIEVRSTVQVTGIMQKNIVPMAYLNNEYDKKAVMRIEAFLQERSESGYMKTFAKFSITLENYNGLEVFTVAMPKQGGYDWESEYASFRNEQTAVAHFIGRIMERIREENADDAQSN